MKPNYTITSEILHQLAAIFHKLGLIEAAGLNKPTVTLRRTERIKTISSTLQIEGNTMTLEQVTDFIEGKRVVAAKKDITELKNAIRVYDEFWSYKPFNLNSLCKAHQTLMKELLPDAGRFRTKAVGIAKGDVVTFVAPPPTMVKGQLTDLLNYIKKDKDPMILKSCVFHYEFEFLHPFSDGNGRIGRLWQSLLLSHFNPVFEFIPIESLIKKRQEEYYRAFEKSHAVTESTPFIEFMLSVIDQALDELLRSQNVPKDPEERIRGFLQTHSGEFTRNDYMVFWLSLSPATASRDLRQAVEKRILTRTGDKSTTRYQANHPKKGK